MENRKERVIKILKRVAFIVSLGFNAIFIVALIIGGVASKKKGTNVSCALAETPIQEKVEFKQDNKKFISYNDTNQKITFTSEELNNYVWNNLGQYLFNQFEDSSSDLRSLLNNSNVYYNSDEYSVEDIAFEEDYWFLNYVYSSKYVYFDTTDCKFLFDDTNGVVDFQLPMDWNLISLSSEQYLSIKNAIDLDIQANEYGAERGIFETLTESSVAFISSIGSGIGYMIAIFYDSANSQLTTIGLLSVIVVAVSLSYFLFRLIIGLIRMRG